MLLAVPDCIWTVLLNRFPPPLRFHLLVMLLMLLPIPLQKSWLTKLLLIWLQVLSLLPIKVEVTSWLFWRMLMVILLVVLVFLLLWMVWCIRLLLTVMVGLGWILICFLLALTLLKLLSTETVFMRSPIRLQQES